ncbi:oxysterol-binding protein, partial [Tanacetum coccineum]
GKDGHQMVSFSNVSSDLMSSIILQPDETLAHVSFIGDDMSSSCSRHHHRTQRHKSRLGIVHLKVSSFRESRSDDKRFYIFTATKTHHLRTSSNKQRLAWIQALTSSSSSNKNLFNFYDTIHVSLSTQGLRNRLVQEGVGEEAVKDCEQIMFLEFDHLQTQLHLLSQERSTLLDTLRQLEISVMCTLKASSYMYIATVEIGVDLFG